MANYYLNNDGTLSNAKKKKKAKNNYVLQNDGTLKKTVTQNVSSQDIAPVKTTVNTKNNSSNKWFDGWFKKSEGKTSQAVVGTGTDTILNALTGVLGMGEDFVDMMNYTAAGSYTHQQMKTKGYLTSEDFKVADQIRKESEERIKKDLYDEKEVAKKILAGSSRAASMNALAPAGVTTADDFKRANQSYKDTMKYLNEDMERYSVLDDKSRGVMQSAGQLGATALLSTVGVPWYLTTGVTSFGGEVENALNQGATLEEAGMSGLITAGAEILTEKLSGGISFGGKTLDDGLTNILAKNISTKGLRTLSKVGMDFAGEGSEEVVSQFFSRLGSALYKEENLSEILASEEAFDEYLTSFISGGILGGTSSGVKAVRSSVKGTDVLTGYTKNEQAVFDKVVENRIKEKEKVSGKKLTSNEKSEIYEQTQIDLERGDIDIETIESVLGGNTLNRYNAIDEQETSLTKKLEELKNAPNTVGNSKQYDSIENQLKELQSKNEKAQLKQQLSKEVFGMTLNDSRLQESYNQRAKRGQDYTADLSKYDSKHRAVIQQAMDSGILNDTRKTHEFVDLVAKLSAETGVSFDFLNNQKLKESGFAIEGKIINGFKNGDRIAINMESKNALNSVVGHEITHVLEGSPELYKALQNSVIGYAKQIGVYDSKYKDVVHLYRNQFQNDDLQTRKAKYDAEITADLVGEYIFSDIDFVRSLSTQNRNVFQKVYEEIKYFLKSVKAGSDAEKQLIKAKKIFEDVYRENSKSTVKEDGHEDGDTQVQYSMQVEDKDTIDFLENQEHIVTYKAMQLIDGKLYPPMAAKVKGENGRYQLTNPSELGKWQQATEDPKNIKKFKNGVGYYTLNKGDGTSVDAAYNPYEHSSNLVLNDQFESAHRRDNLVTVEGIIPTSEMSSGYRAEFAKDSTGVMDWHSGVVAGKLKDNKRQVYLSRYFKPVRIMDDSEVAAKYKEILDGQDVPVPFNVVSPSLLSELEKAGVDIDYDGSPMYQYYAKKSAEKNATKNNINNEVKVMKDNTAVKYSLATWTPETKKKVKNNLVKAGHDSAQVDKWIDDVNGVASVIAANKDRLDFEAADNQTMLKNNQEYVKTLDASTLCAKRLVYQGTFDAIQHRLPNTVLTSDDLIELANMMKENGVEAPCSVCYVESRRRHLGKFAQDWLDGYEGEYIPNLDEVTTSDGLETLRHTHPQTYKDFVDAMNKKGSSNPKVVQLRTEYRNEIMKLTPKQIEKIEAIGGLRVQSFSDFETPHLLDMMQAVMDMSAKGITSQAYTKVPNFAWVFGDTGIKINLSLIAEGDGFDADGNLAFSSVEGMDINDAMALRDAYSENVGTIIVGANDKHILACMQDDRIDYIIPFHRSGWGQNELKLMGLDSYKDYTYGQKEHDLATGKGLANLYPPDYWDYNLTGKENAERYLNLCARTGREPKFSEFLVNNGDGSYSLQPDGSTDGYWKTLIDFKMYNNDGKGAAQQKVQPNFNMEQAYRVLDEYEGGANKLPVSNEVVEKFVAKIKNKNLAPEPENVQYSISQDSKGRTLTKEQQEKFKDSVVRDENGYLKPLYHGSESMAFTEFNIENGVWLSETQSYAEVYSGNWHSWRDDYEDAPVRSDINGLEKEVYADEDLRVYELYADIKNPFDIGEINGTLSEGKVSDLANRLGHYIADQTGDMKQGGKVAREVRQLAKNYIGEKAYNFTRTKEFIDYAKQLGFDGFEATENGKKTYCVFNSADQVKLTTNQTPTSNKDIRYSVSQDTEGNALNENVKRWAQNTKAVDENGFLKVLHHGTATGEFYVFDKTKASVEGDWGAGFYLTDSDHDVERNYEDGGADFENKVSRLAERIESEEDVDYETAEEMAREQLYKGGYRVDAYVKIENPAIVGETRLFDMESYMENYDESDFEDYDEYMEQIEQEISDDIDNVIWDIENNLDIYGDTSQIASVLWESINEGGMDIETLKHKINDLYLEDSEGNIVGNEVARQIIESLGYDGIIDNTVSEKFSNMGLDADTTHYIVFKPNQIKSVTNQNPTENPDIRYSLSDKGQSIAPMRNGYYSEDVLLDKGETQLSEENSTSEVEEIAPVGNVPVIEEPREEQIPEVPQTPEQILYSLEESQDAKLGEMDTKVDAVEEEDTPELSVEEQYSARVDNYRTAIEGYNNSKAETEKAFDDVIAQKQAEYDGLKRKDTLRASNLLMQMENLRLRKANNLSKFDTRIEKTQNRLDKMIAEEDMVKERMYGKRRKEAHEGIVNNIKSYFTSKGFDLDTVLGNAKNLSTFSTVDNTPQRVMEKSLGYKEGQALADVTVNKVAQNESEGIRWVNGIVKELKQISKEYGIKPRSKESAAAQKYAEGYYVDENDRIMPYKDEQLMAEFSDPVKRQNIVALATDPRIRKIYDDAFDLINDSRRKNHYKEIPKRNNYYLHTMEKTDIFSRLGTPFNPQDIGSADLPTDINGMTADFTPGQPYFASANARKGYKTTYDLLGGVEKYVNSAKNQIFHIGDIQTLRALRNYIADMYGQAKGFEGLDELSNVEVAERIKQIQSNHLSSFAKFLNEEANIIAGKTSLIDRGLEGIIGRRGIKVVETINRQVGSNMVGFNVSSALTNVVSGVQAMAKSNKFDVLKAFTQTVSNRIGSIYGKSDGFTEENSGYIRRQGIERFSSRPVDKINDAGYFLMGAVDNVTSEFILRMKYNELTRKGMPSEQAHIEADKWAHRILGDRSIGQQPQLYNSKMLGLITKFQLEVRNQLDSQFYDTIQEANVSAEDIDDKLAKNMKVAAKSGAVMFELAVLQHVFGKAFESVTGYNPAFDLIEILMTVIGADDDEESEDTVMDNVEQGFLDLLEDLPYTSTFTGGRIPIESALPIKELITGENDYGQEVSRKDTLKEVAPYYILPTGYGQIKKTEKGLSMFDEDLPVTGSYTDTGNLRFPVEDTVGNRVKAGLFGQYANENAREYFDRGEAPLKEKQIQEYMDLELPIRDYWDYRKGLKKQEELEDKFEYINDLDVTDEQKNIMINNVVKRKEKIDMSNYDDFENFEEFDWYTKNTEKYNFLKEYGISYAEYKADEDTKEKYDSDYRVYENYPEKVTLSKAINSNWIEYRGWYKDLNEIRADKDANGNSISGTSKAKKMAYIENLNLDAGQKMILHRIFYDGKKDKNLYNPQIVEYLDSRNDISYEEKVTILEELDMKVYPDGRITW